ncbi:MAG: twin-arginine translocation signal domain-containing protein [Candidatus Hydrogenedentota bacterium]
MTEERRIGRRGFLKTTAAMSAGAGLAKSFEERNLLAQAEEPSDGNESQAKELPKGKLGDLEVSRLIVGGNLLSGFAHSRDLTYVSPLVKNYHTDEKVCETFQICEQNGINTAQIRVDEHTMRVISKYYEEWGGTIQWLAQLKEIPRDIDWALENGASALYYQGAVADSAVENDRLEEIHDAVDRMKMHGVPAGVGAHRLETIKACEETGLNADFYMKTIHPHTYWSAEPEEPREFFSIFDQEPEELIEYMQTVTKPWIGFKVLAAGALSPNEGFEYAFKNGADFICVGMFDFQVAGNAEVANTILSNGVDRERPWLA